MRTRVNRDGTLAHKANIMSGNGCFMQTAVSVVSLGYKPRMIARSQRAGLKAAGDYVLEDMHGIDELIKGQNGCGRGW